MLHSTWSKKKKEKKKVRFDRLPLNIHVVIKDVLIIGEADEIALNLHSCYHLIHETWIVFVQVENMHKVHTSRDEEGRDSGCLTPER